MNLDHLPPEVREKVQQWEIFRDGNMLGGCGSANQFYAEKAILALVEECRRGRCRDCDEWDGPFNNDMGKCCIWTISSSLANPGCGYTHFADTQADGFCHRFKEREKGDGDE